MLICYIDLVLSGALALFINVMMSAWALLENSNLEPRRLYSVYRSDSFRISTNNLTFFGRVFFGFLSVSSSVSGCFYVRFNVVFLQFNSLFLSLF